MSQQEEISYMPRATGMARPQEACLTSDLPSRFDYMNHKHTTSHIYEPSSLPGTPLETNSRTTNNVFSKSEHYPISLSEVPVKEFHSAWLRTSPWWHRNKQETLQRARMMMTLVRGRSYTWIFFWTPRCWGVKFSSQPFRRSREVEDLFMHNHHKDGSWKGKKKDLYHPEPQTWKLETAGNSMLCGIFFFISAFKNFNILLLYTVNSSSWQQTHLMCAQSDRHIQHTRDNL